MRIGSVCSGVDGLALGLEWAGVGHTVWHAEVDPDASKVLAERWPGIPNHGDITACDWGGVSPIDLLVGGYPCQPFSVAGSRRGADDARHLWPAVFDALRVLRPPLALFENVAGHVSLGLDSVLADLASVGFDAWWGLVRAADVGAPHRRARLFLLAADTKGAGERPDRQFRGGDASALRPDGAHVPTGPSLVLGEDLGSGGHAAAHANGAGLGEQRRPEPGRAPHATTQQRGEASPHPDSERRQRCGQQESPGFQGPPGGVADGPGADGWLDEAQDGEAAADSDVGGWGEGAGLREGGAGGQRWGRPADHGGSVQWGPYAPAIERWERIIGRPAPSPVDDRERLNPVFVEWMQGYPEGFVTDIIERRPALRTLGNTVVPQVAALVGAQFARHLNLDEGGRQRPTERVATSEYL